MNQYITGTVIKELRNRYDMTQMELGEKLGVSAKTISKWETGKGYPDITLLEPIAEVFFCICNRVDFWKCCYKFQRKCQYAKVTFLYLSCVWQYYSQYGRISYPVSWNTIEIRRSRGNR